MQNAEEVKKMMIEKGFSIINEYEDSPNEEFPDHTHPGDQFLVVVRGSISITMDGKTTVLNPGDEIFFPANTIHSAKVGPAGCFYIDGERPSN